MKHLILILFLSLSFGYTFSARAFKQDSLRVTVSEGTNMAVALSPDESTIVMALQGTLWALPAKGGKAVSITDEMGDCHEPAWSPDGKKLVFHSFRNGNYHIYTINKDGSGLKQLTSGTSDNREPHWSPDGKSVIFSSDRSGNYDIWKLEISNKVLQQLTTHSDHDFNPVFSRSGNKIAFVSQRENPGIYILDQGKESLAVPTDLRVVAPSWSKDDQKLAFVAYTGKSMLFDDKNTSYIYLANLKDGTLEQVSKDEDLFPFRISWTGNDDLLYAADGQIKNRSIINSGIEIIPFQANFYLNRKAYKKKAYDFDNREDKNVLGITGPMVSPDGKKVVFAALGDIFIQEINGKLEQVTNDAYVDLEPDWSPDGQSLAYISDRGGKMEVYIHNLETDQRKSVTSDLKEECSMPKWSPDGKSIAFYVVNYMKKWGPGVLHRVDLASGTIQEIYKGVHVPSKVSWSADGNTLALMALKSHSTRFREGFNQFVLISLDNDTINLVSPDPNRSLGIRNQNGPAWSPDGKFIAYIKNGTLWVVPVNKKGEMTGKEKQLTKELADNLSWTGDSKNIVYTATDRLKKIQITDGETIEIPINLKWKPAFPKEDFIVHAGNLFTGRDSTYLRNVDIYIQGNRIQRILPHKEHEEGVHIIDASDQVVLPGLFEMHTHQSSNDGLKLGKIWLSYGITSVREPGADPYEALERKESWDSGSRPGPRLFFTGGLMGGTRVYYGLANSVTETNHIRMELDRAKKLNYDLLKTYVRMPDSIQKVLTEGAHAMGIPISSHELYPAIKYNVDAIEHLAGTSRRGYSLLLDANFRSYQDVVQLIAKSGINITPTACLRTGYYKMAAEYDELLNDRRNTTFLTEDFLQNLKSQTSRSDSLRTERGDANYRALLKTLKSIVDAGGRITAGTDAPFAPYGSSLHSELWVFVEAGFSPFQALQAATVHAAEAVGVEKNLGTVEVGKLADLVMVDGNPLQRIQDAMKVRTVIKNGRIYPVQDWLEE